MPLLAAICMAGWSVPSVTFAQSVCLPAPRLLTTMPMGGKAGTQVEITITGEHLDDANQLAFSDPHITATRKLNAAGQPEPNKYLVTIAAHCPLGVHEARLMTRLGISSSRVFSVGNLPESVRTAPNTTLATAMELPVNSICNAVMTDKSVDHYVFQGRKGQRIIVDCATKGIDSKLDVVFIIADSMGRDLLVERRGGALDFAVPEDGKYVIKAHELTFKGGPAYYYRLALWELPAGEPIVRMPSTRTVNSCSWPPTGLPEKAATAEQEPNSFAKAQKISLPCDISGSFFPAADVDVFEFEAKKGEEWWVEVASERFGLPTDPSILVQQVAGSGADEKLTDIAELSDIPSPVKVSSNGYAYDGPPYQAGSSDILGKVVIQQDGIHRLQLSDLFGGTRNDPRNVYRLVIRKAAPDFAVVAWAMHMELRNGDRNALSKPISLRGGSTMALEVVAIRRDGFDGDIELVMDGLPEGMRAQGLKIPKGQSRGIMLVTAAQNAPRAIGSARFLGRAQINSASVEHPCALASFSWPIPDSWGEIPNPRLLADVPVSVSGIDMAPLTLATPTTDVREVVAGEKLTIPLNHTRRSEFSGDTLQLRTLGAGFDQHPQFDVKISADSSEAVIDLARLKPAAGDYLIAFYGSAVAKYRHNPDAVLVAELAKKKAEEEAAAIDAEVKKLAEEAKAAATEKKAEADKAVEAVTVRQKTATAALTAAVEKLKQATQAAQPVDIVDIVVSEPIAIRVKPAGTK
ncbi:MAG: hypothetical protein JWN70_6095 [Planctomycetaceae bacterium]|nr:hypothetical protein [Planctomycetaceae bacterium]